MMKLRCVQRGIWTVLAICDDRGGCLVQELIDHLETDSRSDYDQVMAQLRWAAANGPPRNYKKSRPLADRIFELKTRGGIRIPYFYDQDRLVICTEALRKPKKTEMRAVITRALAAREGYFEAKRRGAVDVIQEES
jgi:hypothetical protein